MKQSGQWWIPDHMNSPGNHIRRSAAIDAALKYLPSQRRTLAIQAGGHIGTWPVRLHEYFEAVFTYEPIEQNFECLLKNVQHLPGVYPVKACLGNVEGPCLLKFAEKNTGKHRVSLNGTVEANMFMIDELFEAFQYVDAIFLDIEGAEKLALEGAERTLTRHKPLVLCEQNNLSEHFGYTSNDLEQYLSNFGYAPVERWEEDVIYVPGEWKGA